MANIKTLFDIVVRYSILNSESDQKHFNSISCEAENLDQALDAAENHYNINEPGIVVHNYYYQDEEYVKDSITKGVLFDITNPKP